jgi:hypothetical protein
MMNHARVKRDVVTIAWLAGLVLAGCSVMDDFSKFDFTDRDELPVGAGDAGTDGGAGDGDGDLPDGSMPDAGPTSGCQNHEGCDEPFTCVDHACVFVPPARTPAGIFSSSGGGAASNSRYRLRASFGVPQPFGKAKNDKYQLALGPGAGRP